MSTERVMDWRPIFGHDEPYDAQVDGIETAVDTAREGGFRSSRAPVAPERR